MFNHCVTHYACACMEVGLFPHLIQKRHHRRSQQCLFLFHVKKNKNRGDFWNTSSNFGRIFTVRAQKWSFCWRWTTSLNRPKLWPSGCGPSSLCSPARSPKLHPVDIGTTAACPAGSTSVRPWHHESTTHVTSSVASGARGHKTTWNFLSHIKQELGSSWDGRPFGHNRHGPKSGVVVGLPLLGEAGSPSNTISPGPRHTSVPSGVLIHPPVWPQWAKIGGAVTAVSPFFRDSGVPIWLNVVEAYTCISN